jgi:hypothetical protein
MNKELRSGKLQNVFCSGKSDFSTNPNIPKMDIASGN